jgi:hypothetical protein
MGTGGIGISHDPGPNAVFGHTANPNAAGVSGLNDTTKATGFIAGPNPLAASQAIGAFGQSDTIGVFGFALTAQGIGVHGNTAFGAGTGVWGNTSTGVAVLATCDKTGLAGKFVGDVQITGKLDAPKSTITCFDVIISNADCAEEFDLSGAETAEPGTVMCLEGNGSLRPSSSAYDKKVAGVISGAGDYKPGIVLDRQQGQAARVPLALVGKVFCKVDADFGPIEVGDLLTTSATPGHAMKAGSPVAGFGAVIGKALRPLTAGRGLIPILIALQ